MDSKIILNTIEKVVYRLMNLGGADYGKDKEATSSNVSKGLIARDFGIEEWDWPQGVGLYGLTKLQAHLGDDRYDDFLISWFERNIERGLPSRNINTTAPFLALMDLVRRKGDKRFAAMCLERAEWLMNDAPRTEDGGLQHVTSAIGNRDGVSLNDGQIWADTLFMAVLFLSQAGQYFRRLEFVEESIHQFLVHIKYLFEKSNGLMHHGWTFHGRNNFGGIFWCRGNSWFTYGAMEYISGFTAIPIGEGVEKFITDTYISQCNALKELQGESGLWHTVLDDAESYEEASGSAAIAAGMIKGLKMGKLPAGFRGTAEKAIEAIIAAVEDDGTVGKVSAGTGVGMDREHYRNIVIRPMAYGQSLALLALTEALDL